ncbi:MAG TPA: SCO family protein, partial [Woeseiaceae bacterium]|nr:SCO family protein [Woeseiaceae bacterium]
MSGARGLLIAVPVVLVLGGAAWLAARNAGPPPEPQYATPLPEAKPLPDFSLVDQEGRPFTRERLRGRTSLLFFGFTHCPDICPTTLEQLASARQQLADEGPAPQIVFVSVDPERDTPEKLAAYVRHFGKGIVG